MRCNNIIINKMKLIAIVALLALSTIVRGFAHAAAVVGTGVLGIGATIISQLNSEGYTSQIFSNLNPFTSKFENEDNYWLKREMKTDYYDHGLKGAIKDPKKCNKDHVHTPE